MSAMKAGKSLPNIIKPWVDMYTIYSTTRPRRYDTKAIAKGKWLQLVTSGATNGGTAAVVTYADTLPRFYDTELITLQKILQDQQ